LESIGNDEEKTFIMGLIIARLYSFRRLQASNGKTINQLQHLLIIEEAHRLLKNTNTQVDSENANLRAHAVEAFVNMLSEIRHYGQGVVVAEQIPSKLTPDVIKNTNLKLVHRLLAKDDREILAGTMAMDEDQSRHLSVLKTGELVVYTEGVEKPILLKGKNYKQAAHLFQPERINLKENIKHYLNIGRCLLVPNLSTLGIKTPHFGAPNPALTQAIQIRLDQKSAKQQWAIIIVRTLFSRDHLLEYLKKLRHDFELAPGLISIAQTDEGFNLWCVFGAAKAIEARRSKCNIDFPRAKLLGESLAGSLMKLLVSENIKNVASDFDRFTRVYEADFSREVGPYPGCKSCPLPCMYRTEVARLIDKKDVANARTILTTRGYQQQTERYQTLADPLASRGAQWLGAGSTEQRNIGYCAGLQIAELLGLDEMEQITFGAEFALLMVS
jgi:hypothetical protein